MTTSDDAVLAYEAHQFRLIQAQRLIDAYHQRQQEPLSDEKVRAMLTEEPMWLSIGGKFHRPGEDFHVANAWITVCGIVLDDPRLVMIDAPLASLPRQEEVCQRCGNWPDDSRMAQAIAIWRTW